MAAVTICNDFGALKIKSVTIYPSICHEVMGQDSMILVFWMLSFEPTFSLSSLTFIKRILNFSLLSSLRMVPSAYLRLLIFLPAILIQTCASSSPAFLMMYFAYKLNSRVIIYRLDVLLSWFGTRLLFHVQFQLLLPDLHTGFSRGRSDGLVFPSL